MKYKLVIKLLICTFAQLCAIVLQAQEGQEKILQMDSIIVSLPESTAGNYIKTVLEKAGKLSRQLNKAGDKVLLKLQKEEDKIIRKLMRVDSAAAGKIIASAKKGFGYPGQLFSDSGNISHYIPGFDSICTSLNFMKKELIKMPGVIREKLHAAIGRMDDLKRTLKKTDDIKQYIRARRQLLREHLEKAGFTKQIKKISKLGYYYAQQVREYREVLNDPEKIEKKVIEILSRTRIFQDFFRKNGMMASFFPSIPVGGGSGSAPQSGFAGIQTRSQVMNFIQQSSVSSAPMTGSALQRNIQDIQSQIGSVQSRLNGITSNDNSLEMPDFRPNNLKTRPFWKRLEYGFNFQTQKGNNLFVTSGDLGISIGYRLSEKNSIGIGASYKIGFGTGWRNIRFTHEGIGLRTFVDIKVKDQFSLSGGYEQNYRTIFNHIDELKNMNAWQKSGLLGVSKTISLKTKMLKKTKVQLLWDFLSYTQKPRANPVVFRIGYVL